MLPDRVSNPRPLTYESGALPFTLRCPALCKVNGISLLPPQICKVIQVVIENFQMARFNYKMLSCIQAKCGKQVLILINIAMYKNLQ